MMIEQLLYVSTAAADVGERDLRRIEVSSSVHNTLHGITGLLCFDGSRFLQLIEGRGEEVEALMSRIAHDRLHVGIAIVGRHFAAARAFPHWSMRCVRVSAAADERRGQIEVLVPPELNPGQREALLAF